MKTMKKLIKKFWDSYKEAMACLLYTSSKYTQYKFSMLSIDIDG